MNGRIAAPAFTANESHASAADLKFLHRLRRTHFRNFKSKSGTRIICLLVPLLLPKFVSGVPQCITNFGSGALARISHTPCGLRCSFGEADTASGGEKRIGAYG